MKKPVVAIIGKPNVGKSTLFNRLIRQNKSLIDGTPGVTRDRIYGNASYEGKEFIVIDTGGLDATSEDVFLTNIANHVQLAIEEADVIIALFDGKGGLTSLDYEIVERMRPLKKPVFFTINKVDESQHEDRLIDFYSLGIEPLFPVSAAHGRGISDLLEGMTSYFNKRDFGPEEEENLPKIAIIGRPNVGKSSFLNKLLGYERSIVSEIPGTTRDTIDSIISYEGRKYKFIDTAGIRKKGKVSSKIETFSIIKSLKCIDFTDIALLLIDAQEGVTEQDVKVAGYAHDEGKGIVLVVNKWDLVPAKDNSTTGTYAKAIREKFKYVGYAPILFVSSKTGQRVVKCFQYIDTILETRSKRLSTSLVNKILEEILASREPGVKMGSRPRIYYMTQVETAPPSFIVFTNRPEAIHFSYRRFIMNKIREYEPFTGNPIRLIFKGKEKPLNFKHKTQKRER